MGIILQSSARTSHRHLMRLVFFACAVRILVPTPGHTNAYDLPQGLSLLLFGFEAVPWLCAGGSARGDGPGRGGVCGRRAGGHAGPPHQRRRPASGPSPSDKPTNTFDSECVCRQTTNHATSRQGKEWRGGCGSYSHCFGGLVGFVLVCFGHSMRGPYQVGAAVARAMGA